MTQPIEQFREAARQAGFNIPKVIPDGRVHRFSTNGRHGDDAGAYVLHSDGFPNGWALDWRSGKKFEWSARGYQLTAADRKRISEQIAQAKAARDAEEAEHHARAAVEAARILESATPASDDHPYLARKGIKAHGLKQDGSGNLLVPMYRDDALVGAQLITPEGKKRFLPGTSKQGACFVIGDACEVLCIAEGFATAATIHEATKFACAVAFDAGNLSAVAKALESFPGEVILCADDDWKGINLQTGEPRNTGLIKAREAAAATGARLAKPDFGEDRQDKEKDFNDLAQRLGHDAVRACIHAAEHVELPPDDETAQPERTPNKSEVVFEPICAGTLLREPAPPRRWIVPGFIPKKVVTLLGGDGGVGKSTLAMQLGIAAAMGMPWLGIEIEKTRTLVLSAEDDQDEIHYRCEKIVEGLPGDREANRIALEGNLWLLDATDQLDPTLATYDASGIAPTDTFSRIEQFIRENGIGLLIADSAADVFAEEIDRHAVRSFIRQLKAFGCTVALLAHPSVDGIKTGRGYSGSTHWNNAVRSRLYLTRAEAANGSVPDPDLRVLDMAKANRARAGQRMILRWTENGFVRDDTAANSLDGLAQELKAEEVFLCLLKRFCEEGRPPSPQRSPSYAPAMFAAHPGSEGISKAAFEKAMNILLSAGKIEIVSDGPPSRRYQRLKVKEG